MAFNSDEISAKNAMFIWQSNDMNDKTSSPFEVNEKKIINLFLSLFQKKSQELIKIFSKIFQTKCTLIVYFIIEIFCDDFSLSFKYLWKLLALISICNDDLSRRHIFTREIIRRFSISAGNRRSFRQVTLCV